MTQEEFSLNLMGVLHFMSLVGLHWFVTSWKGTTAEVKLIGGDWDAYKARWEGYGGICEQGEGDLSEYCTFRG
jgi:hypothetical protein